LTVLRTEVNDVDLGHVDCQKAGASSEGPGVGSHTAAAKITLLMSFTLGQRELSLLSWFVYLGNYISRPDRDQPINGGSAFKHNAMMSVIVADGLQA
jgi:hypothetical protein